MPIAKLNGVDLCWEEIGSGPPLILVPGFASGAWSWSWQAADLSRSFRVITFDPRGVSRSRLQDAAEVSIRHIADDVASLLDHIGLPSARLLGISFGGFVAQDFAVRFPEKLDKLVLASTSSGGPNHVMPSTETLASFAGTSGLNSAARIRKNLVLAFSDDYIRTHADEVERFCNLREENPLSEESYRQQLTSAMTFNAEDRLPHVRAQTLVISGDRDMVVPFQNSINLAARIPNARLAVISNAGHMAFIERAQEFNRIVTEFLKEQ